VVVNVNAKHEEASGIPLAQRIAFLNLAIASSTQAARHMRFDLADARQLYAVLMLYALTDHGRAALCLAKAGIFTGIGMMTRSAIDAYADLCNTCEQPRYFKNLEAADASHWKKLLEVASQGRVAALRGLTESPLLPVGRRLYADQLRALEAEGFGELGIKERFSLASLKDEYQSMYAILSSETHNNISGLRNRYVIQDGDELRIVEPGQMSSNDHNYGMPATVTMGEMLVRGTEKVLRLLGHGVAVMSAAARELERIAAVGQAEDERARSEQRTEASQQTR
jgi:Family of unknown function (DUF5677)